MAEQSLTISFGSEKTGDSDDWLKLEQKPWSNKDASGFNEWMASEGIIPTVYTVFVWFDVYLSECSAEDGGFDTVIYVSKSRPDLQYSLTCTNGILGEKSISEQVREKSFTLTGLSNELDVGTRIDTLYSVEWEGNVYGAGGSLVSHPAVTLKSGKLSWGGDPVFGVLRVKYKSDVDAWPLNVTARAEIQSDPNTLKKDLKAAYECTVVAIWNEKITAMNIENPPLLGNCSGGVSICVGDCSGDDSHNTSDPSDDNGDGSSGDMRRVIEVDACTGEVLDDYTEQIVE